MEKHVNLDNETIDEENVIIDKDMEKLLAILHQIPETEIPDRFEQRFSEALKIEGDKIREERFILAAKKKRKLYVKVAATAAACFVVVFASLSMYNDGIGPATGQNPAEESADAQMNISAEADMFSAAKEDGSESIAEMEDMNQNYPVTAMEGVAPPSRQGEPNGESFGQSGIYGAQVTEEDILCREGSKYIQATEEYLAYRKLVDEYLAGYEFEVTACKRDSVTGSYLFQVLILMNPEGQIVNAPLILRGEQGEIYEQQAEEQSTGDGSAPFQGQSAENDPSGEESHNGSD